MTKHTGTTGTKFSHEAAHNTYSLVLERLNKYIAESENRSVEPTAEDFATYLAIVLAETKQCTTFTVVTPETSIQTNDAMDAIERFFELSDDYPTEVSIQTNNQGSEELLRAAKDYQVTIYGWLQRKQTTFHPHAFLDTIREAEPNNHDDPQAIDMVYPFCTG